MIKLMKLRNYKLTIMNKTIKNYKTLKLKIFKIFKINKFKKFKKFKKFGKVLYKESIIVKN